MILTVSIKGSLREKKNHSRRSISRDLPSTLRSQDLKRGIVKGMLSMIFDIVFDSDFTFHYEIKGPDESVKLGRNIHRNVGQRSQEDKKR